MTGAFNQNQQVSVNNSHEHILLSFGDSYNLGMEAWVHLM